MLPFGILQYFLQGHANDLSVLSYAQQNTLVPCGRLYLLHAWLDCFYDLEPRRGGRAEFRIDRHKYGFRLQGGNEHIGLCLRLAAAIVKSSQ